jgi:uncharacterized membrane protein YjgN (DUF898 family)
MKNLIPKKIVLTSIVLVLSFLIINTAAAAPFSLTGKLSKLGQAAGFEDRPDSLAIQIGQIISIALAFLGVIFLAYIVYAGYIWLTAAGNDEKLTKAKSILRNSIIGLIIVLSAYAITAFVIAQIETSTGYIGGVSSEPEDIPASE